MARAYSTDLRERVVDYVECGGSRKDACRIYKVSLRTLSNWIKRFRDTGDVSASRLGSRPWKLNHEEVIKYIDAHPDSSLKSIASYFDTTTSTIFYICKKYKYTRKKNTLYVERNEEVRQRYLSLD